MLDKLLTLKKLIWAFAVIICLFALFIGLVFAIVSPYDSEDKYPLVQLGQAPQKSGKNDTSSGSEAGPVSGQLNELKKSGDAGIEYISSLYFLCDSIYADMASCGADSGRIWLGESGSLPISTLTSAKIIYPGDGSAVSVSNAAMISKPSTLVLLIGSDGLSSTDELTFKNEYSALLDSIASVSPDTCIICCSICPFTASYIPTDGLTTQIINNANLWLKEVCASHPVWYADIAANLCDGGFLKTDYAAADGKTLNSNGLSVIANYLRSHCPE